MRHVIAIAALLSWGTAAAQLPVVGDSRVEQFIVADGLRVVEHVRLRSKSADLTFVDRGDEPFPFVTLASKICEVRLEDRNLDGKVDTVRARERDRLMGACSGTDAVFTSSQVESGALEGILKDCLIVTTHDYEVMCQPTRFGRPEGEAWVVVSGWADRFGRGAMGRPDSLIWDDHLLILDGPSGIVYRVEPYDAPKSATEAAVFEDNLPAKPDLLRRSRLQTGETYLSKERKKILNDREAAAGRRERMRTESVPLLRGSSLRSRLQSPPPDPEEAN